MRVYFDNATATKPFAEVTEIIKKNHGLLYASPHHIYKEARESDTAIEQSRRIIAGVLHTTTESVGYTLSYSEAIRKVIEMSIEKYGIEKVIVSPAEDRIAQKTVSQAERVYPVKKYFFHTDLHRNFTLKNIEQSLKENTPALLIVSHTNPLTGKLLPVKKIAKLCHEYNSVLLCDISLSIPYLPIDINTLQSDFCIAQACKFYGGNNITVLHSANHNHFSFAQIDDICPVQWAGVAKALQICTENKNMYGENMLEAKRYFAEKLSVLFPDIDMQGNDQRNLSGIITAFFPKADFGHYLTEKLDMKGIACADKSSYFDNYALFSDKKPIEPLSEKYHAIRFSFGIENTIAEADYCLPVLKNIRKR